MVKQLPQRYWQSKINRRKYLRSLLKILKFNHPKDIYRLMRSHFRDNHGYGVLDIYNGSIYGLLEELFPIKGLLPWQFTHAPNGWWKKRSNCRWFLFWFANLKGIKRYTDFYLYNSDDIRLAGGFQLLKQFEDQSLFSILKALLPQYSWEPWLFSKTIQNTWLKKEHRMGFILRRAVKELKITKPEDWYDIDFNQFLELSRGWLRHFNGNFIEGLQEAYPDYIFKPWLFKRTRRGTWDNDNNIKNYLIDFGVKMGFSTFKDWLTLSSQDIVQNGDEVLFCQHFQKSIINLLNFLFPENIDIIKKHFIETTKYRRQLRLYHILIDMFPSCQVIWEYTHTLRYSKTNQRLKIDMYLADFKMAFEYQGEQHYHPIKEWGGLKSLKVIQQNDVEKKQLLEEHGEALVCVPYWWDGTEKQLKEQYLPQFKDLNEKLSSI